MSTALAVFFSAGALNAAHAFNALSFTVENDMYFSDRYYTNGLALNYTTDGEGFPTSYLQFRVLDLISSPDAQRYQSIGGGQKMFVPQSIEQVNPPAWDRPYAGFLYASFGAHTAARNTLNSFALTFGMTGPASLAEDTQKFWHRLLDCTKPMGWDNQIANEFGFIVSYNRAQRFLRTDVGAGMSADFVGVAGLDAGNVLVRGTFGGVARCGYNLPYNFLPKRIDYSGGEDVAFADAADSGGFNAYFYAGAFARFVGYDITLNGNAFSSSSPSVTPEWCVGDFLAGISVGWPSWEFGLCVSTRTADFKTQGIRHHTYWSASVKYLF